METINIIGVDEKIYKHTCKNGFEVYIWKYDLTDEVDMSLVVKYGSLYNKFEVDGKIYTVPNGIAHFLEHVKFNEEEGKTANDFFSKIGSYANAFTTYDNTSYEVTTNKDVKRNLEHLLYYVFNPYFTKELIEKEKGIIIEEAKGSLNNAYSKGYHKLLDNLYQKNTRKNLITGTPEEVKSITIEDVLNVYNNFYVPDNMFLSIGGNVDPKEVISIVDNFFEGKKFNKYKATILKEEEPVKVLKDSDEITGTVNKNKLYLAYKYDRKLFKYDKLMTQLLFNRIVKSNFGTISEFNEYIMNSKIADELCTNTIVDDDSIVIIFESSGDDLDLIRKLIDEKMNNLSIDEQTFNRIKKVKIASCILGYDNPSSVVYNMLSDIIDYNHILDNLKEIQENSKIEDVYNVINLLDNSNTSYLKIIPKEVTNEKE